MSSPPLSILLRWHLTATAAPHMLSDHEAPVLYPPDETAPNGIPREDQVMLMANSILLCMCLQMIMHQGAMVLIGGTVDSISIIGHGSWVTYRQMGWTTPQLTGGDGVVL